MKPSTAARVIAIAIALPLLAIGCRQADNSKAITLSPGSDVAEIVANAPEGTTFYFETGTYRTQTIRPKDNQKFIGKGTADTGRTILTGAQIMSDWTIDGDFWVADGLPDPLHSSGYCSPARLCTPREDLFVDGKRIERAPDRESARGGKWFRSENKAYLSFDPTGQMIELGLTPYAFAGSAKNVTIQDLIVEKFASEAQRGAILGTDSEGWQITAVVARWNHGGGLEIGDGMTVRGGSFSHNGQIGIVGIGKNVTIENVEIAYNNFAGFNAGWEAGGTKFKDTDGLIVRNSCVYRNLGPGLWTDINNVNTLFENNVVAENRGDGIKHEISYSATIRNNVVGENGVAKDNWLWGSQILIQNSSSVEVTGNTVFVDADYGNAISMIYQERGIGTFGPWTTTKNVVRDNTIVFRGKRGRTGAVADYEREKFFADETNRFEKNRYYVKDPNFPYWDFENARRTWTQVQAINKESGSKVLTSPPPTNSLDCER